MGTRRKPELLHLDVVFRLGQDARRRLETMCRTNDGFEIAEVDMELRGPGDVMGTQQSGVPDESGGLGARQAAAFQRAVPRPKCA